MAKASRRKFSREFKLGVLERMAAGESATALGREFEINRIILYRWRDALRDGGEAALREGPGRPAKAEANEMALARGPAARARDLAEARRQIAELERKVGQQQLDLDFFRQALRHFEGLGQATSEPGVTTSSSSSRR
jgi:transposase-like protein